MNREKIKFDRRRKERKLRNFKKEREKSSWIEEEKKKKEGETIQVRSDMTYRNPLCKRSPEMCLFRGNSKLVGPFTSGRSGVSGKETKRGNAT